MTTDNRTKAPMDEHTLMRLEALVGEADAPWSLVPSTETTSGTIVLHDCHGVSIADLYTEGPPCACDQIIAIAPTTILDLIAEVRRLRRVAASGWDSARLIAIHAQAPATEKRAEQMLERLEQEGSSDG